MVGLVGDGVVMIIVIHVSGSELRLRSLPSPLHLFLPLLSNLHSVRPLSELTTPKPNTKRPIVQQTPEQRKSV
jgi:hypothetical protein